jgi:hypothetical protein
MKLTALLDTAAPEPEKTIASANTKPAISTKGKDAHAPWIQNVNDFKRRERREFQVSRYG